MAVEKIWRWIFDVMLESFKNPRRLEAGISLRYRFSREENRKNEDLKTEFFSSSYIWMAPNYVESLASFWAPCQPPPSYFCKILIFRFCFCSNNIFPLPKDFLLSIINLKYSFEMLNKKYHSILWNYDFCWGVFSVQYFFLNNGHIQAPFKYLLSCFIIF